MVLQRGKLNLRTLEMFERTGHAALEQRIAELGIVRWTPPLLKSSRDGCFDKPPRW